MYNGAIVKHIFESQFAISDFPEKFIQIIHYENAKKYDYKGSKNKRKCGKTD